MSDDNVLLPEEAELAVGRGSIQAYSRLSYTMWYALAEFIDNSTQARDNYAEIMDEVLRAEDQPLIVTITHNKLEKTLTIEDNSIGMTKNDLVAALQIATPTPDSVGRSKYGMGMKTAACWIGKRWKVITTEWSSGEEWTAEVDVDGIVNEGANVPLTPAVVSPDEHYTKIVISELHRRIQKRTEENIRSYLGSMYRYDIREGRLKILYGTEEILPPDDMEYDTDTEGNPYYRVLPETKINGKTVRGSVGVRRKGSGGRKYGGFSLFRNKRMIVGFPQAWKPRSIYGGVDDEGGNNLIAQRLTGLLELDDFDVSHTKDAILFADNEEEELEKWLEAQVRDYRTYASTRRGQSGTSGLPWSRQKVRELLQEMKKEFANDEMRDTIQNASLPPLETILSNNTKQLEALKDEDEVVEMVIFSNLRIKVSLQERSENDPYVTIVSHAEPGMIHVIVNNLHSYYLSLDSSDQIDECIRQYLYDAVAEYRVNQQFSRTNPDSVRRMKDSLLKVKAIRVENAAATIRSDDVIELHSVETD